MIKPTIGRVVWYHPSHADAVAKNPGDVHPALITKVWSASCINLAIFDSEGVPYQRTSILLVQDGESPPAFGYAEWMPYQIGQAARTEQAEALAKGFSEATQSDAPFANLPRSA